MTDETAAPIVYVDANPFIYYIDGEESTASRVRPFFDFRAKRPGIAITSELTRAEVLAKATPDARRNYFNLIVWSKLFELKPVTRDILIDTADYRRVSRKTSPDGR
jgi:predicted nucleic acid-binding protein